MPETRQQLGRRRAALLLGLLILAGAAIYAVPIWWGVPFTGTTWAFDEIKPLQVGPYWPVLYPPAHRHVLQAVFNIAELVHFDELVGSRMSTFLLTARATTVLMACLTALALYRCARRLTDRATALLAVAATIFGTNWVFYSKTANLDIPYVFWFTLSLLFFLRALERKHWSDHVLFAVCGALAITTKTQAYALYLVAPVALVLNLRPTGVPFWTSLRRALFDRRILEAAGACLAVTLLVFGELGGSGELRQHYQALTALDFEDYRTVALSARGVATLLGETLRLLSFVLGAPVLLASLAGLGMALARPRHNLHLLSLLLFVVPYWLVFVAATGFNYDRHYLPIAVVMGLFAGKALSRLAASGPPLRPLRLAAVGLVLAYAVWSGVSVDLMMLGDARYEAERWIEAKGLRGNIAGLGSKELLPRGLPSKGIDAFARSRRREAGTNPNVWHNCVALNQIGVEYLIPDSPHEMRGPGLNYRQHRRFHNAAPAPLVNPEGVTSYASNVVKVASDVVVFRRTDEECVDPTVVPRTLEALRRENDPERRAELADAIFDAPAVRAVALAGEDLAGVRLTAKGWTLGTLPAAVAAQNLGWEEELPEFLLRLSRPKAPYPVTAYVDDGTHTRSIVFTRPEEKTVALPALAPGQRSLAIVWIDKGWRDEDNVLRGIRVLPGAWPGSPEERVERFDATLLALSEGTVDESVRVDLGRAMRRGGVPDPRPVGRFALMAGGWSDGWTRGTEPAAVLVHNPRRRPARVQLALSCFYPRAQEPLVAVVDGGGQERRFELDCTKGARDFTLDLLPPGGERLYIVRSDRARLTPTPPVRLLGVLVRRVRLVAEGGQAAGS